LKHLSVDQHNLHHYSKLVTSFKVQTLLHRLQQPHHFYLFYLSNYLIRRYELGQTITVTKILSFQKGEFSRWSTK